MIKTITLDGLTSVTIKQSPYDMARFCWLYNHSDSDIYASCVNAECTENADEVRRISSGEFGMLDTESYETLYLNGSGAVEIVTSALLVCPFDRGGKGGGSGGMKVDTLLDITISTSENSPANNSIVTLDGNMLDYKFIYVEPTMNQCLHFSTPTAYSDYSQIRIWDASVLTWDSYKDREFEIANIYYEARILCISPNQIKITYSGTAHVKTERLVILGIK